MVPGIKEKDSEESKYEFWSSRPSNRIEEKKRCLTNVRKEIRES